MRICSGKRWVVFLSCLVLLGWLAPAQGTAQQESGIFLTRAEQKEIPGTGKKIWVPTNEKIGFAWSDTPFAVHIPWEMETEIQYVADYMGAPKHRQICAKDYLLKVFLKGFAFQKEREQVADTLNVVAAGCYRLDGQKIFTKDRDSDYVGQYRFGDSLPWLPNLEFKPNENVESQRLGGREVAGQTRVAFWLVIDPRNRWESMGASDDASSSYYFRVLNGGIKDWPLFGEKCTGKLMVKLDVLEGEPAKATEGPLADSPQNKKPREVLATEYEITVKQNAWVITGAQAKNQGDWSQKLNDAQDAKNDWRLQDTGTNVNGRTLTSAHRLVGQREDRPGEVFTTDVRIQVELPQKLWDHQTADARCVTSQASGGSRYLPSLLTPFGLSRMGGNCAWSAVTLAAYAYDPKSSGQKGGLAFCYDLYSYGNRSEDANNLSTVTHAFAIEPMRSERVSLNAASYFDKTLPNTWTSAERLPSHPLLSLDIRFWTQGMESADYSQLPPDSLPVKHFDVFATRLSDIENNVIGQASPEGPSKPEEPLADDYYEWLAEFTTEVFPQAQAQIGDIRAQLTALAAIEDAYLQQFQTLLLLDYRAFRPLSEDKDLLDHFWNVIRQQRDKTLDPTVTKIALAALRQTREDIREKKAAIRPLQQQLIDQGLKIMKQVVEKADVAGIRFNESHPEHKETISYLRDKYDLLKLELYDAAKLYEGNGFEKLMSELGFGSGTEQELRELLRAKACLARARGFERRMAIQAASPLGLLPDGDPELKAKAAKSEALEAIQAVLKVNPENQEAKFMRQVIEVGFLESIAAKLQQEKQASIAGFQKFFEERGFNIEDPGGWWSGLFESVYAWTGMGPVSSILGWSKANALAEQIDVQHTRTAKHQVALLAIRRLVRNGMPLEKVSHITPAELEKGMAVNTASQGPLPPEKIARLSEDILQTINELPDLKALAEGQQEQFLQLHPKAYYNLIHPEKSRLEFWSDFFFSPLSVIGWFGPSAITKIEGAWKWFKLSTTATHLALLEDIGEVQRAGQWFYQTMRLETIGSKLLAVPGSALLARVVAQDAAYIRSLGSGMQFLNSGSRLIGTLLLYGGLFVAADQTNIPALKLFCEVIATIGVGDMAQHILSHAGFSVQKAMEKLDEFSAFIIKKRRELAEHGELIAALEKVHQKALQAQQAQRQGLDPETIKQIEDLLAKYEKSEAAKPGTLKLAPGAQADTDVVKTIKVAADALKRGDLMEAGSALKGAKKMHTALTGEAEAVAKKLDEAKEILRKNGEPKPFQHEPSRFQPILQDLNPEAFTLGKNLNPDHPVCAFILQGDNAVRMGDFEAAETIYKAAKKLGEGTPFEQMVNDRLDLMLCARDYLIKLKKTRAAAKPTSINEAIAETEQELAAKLNDLTKNMEKFPGGKNPIFKVKDASGKVFVFKAVNNEEEVFREVISSTLYNALGGKTPTARRVRKVKVPDYDKNGVRVGEKEVDGILYRFAEGKEVGDLTEPEVLALKSDLAPLRAFRLWLLDTDGHMRNFKLSPEGDVIPLDFGFAHIGKTLDLPQLEGFVHPSNQEELMTEALRFRKNLDECVNKHPQLANQLTEGTRALYGWVDRVDGMLSFDDMEPMVRKIQELCKNRSQLEAMIKKAFAPELPPPGVVEEAVETLVKRGEVLEQVLKTRFKQYKLPAGQTEPRPIPLPMPAAAWQRWVEWPPFIQLQWLRLLELQSLAAA